jgi:alkanesulfonate monooxygenase SsuD/methylene tetrahydromethanopterin reductase-like flavin-dependent oxidoreductase (luciferase family)
MKVGVSIHFRNPDQWFKPWDQLFKEEMELAVLADNLGYDTLWCYEHHFTEDGHIPSPMSVCSAILSRTKRIEVGPNLIMPLHDPVMIAEESAVIDLISGGRFLLGLVQGYRPQEYAAWGIDLKERGPRVSEAVDIIKRCWTGEKFSYEGKFWKYKDVKVVPLPHRNPPPILYGARTKRALQRAAEAGIGIISQGEGVESAKIFAQACRDLGKKPGEVRHLRYIHVSEDPGRAWSKIKDHALYMMRMYEKWINPAGDPGLYGIPQGEELTAENLMNSPMYIICTPSEAIKRINDLKAQYPLDELWGLFHFPGLDANLVAETLELFASKVAPYIR